MASPSPPGLGLGPSNCPPNQRFLVWCNSIVPGDKLFSQWYQVVSLTVGATAIVIPLLLFLIYRVASAWGDKSPRRQTKYVTDRSDA